MAGFRLPQSVAQRLVVKAYLSSDHVSDATGKTIAATISKNGAAFTNPAAGATNATEIGNGWYYVDLAAADLGTKGPLVLRGTASGVDNVEIVYRVVDPHNADFDALPAVAAGSPGAVSTYAGGDTPGTGMLLARLTDPRATALDFLDASIVSRSSHSAADVWAAADRQLTAFGFTVPVTVTDKTGYVLDPGQSFTLPGGGTVTLTECMRGAFLGAFGDEVTPGTPVPAYDSTITVSAKGFTQMVFQTTGTATATLSRTLVV